MTLKKFLMKTMFGDFLILLTAPVEPPAIKSIKEEATKATSQRHFEDYIFGNIIISKKTN